MTWQNLSTQKSEKMRLPTELEKMLIDKYQQQWGKEFDDDEMRLTQQLRQIWIFDYWIRFTNKPLEVIESMIISNIRTARILKSAL